MRIDIVHEGGLGTERDWTDLTVEDVKFLENMRGLKLADASGNLSIYRKRHRPHLGSEKTHAVWYVSSPGLLCVVALANYKLCKDPRFRKLGNILRSRKCAGNWYLILVDEEILVETPESPRESLLLGNAQYDLSGEFEVPEDELLLPTAEEMEKYLVPLDDDEEIILFDEVK